MRRGTVTPRRIVADQGPAQRTRWLPVEPRGDARLAEDVRARQPQRIGVRVVADRTLVAGGLQLLLGGIGADALQTERTCVT